MGTAQEFKAFASKGNVVDLAAARIIRAYSGMSSNRWYRTSSCRWPAKSLETSIFPIPAFR